MQLGDTIVIIGTDDYVYSTGRNASGQLGLNDTTDRQVFTKTSIQAKSIVLKSYKPNYWVTQVSSLSTVPTAVYPTSTVNFNEVTAKPISVGISSGVLTSTLKDVEFSQTRELTTIFNVAKTNVVTSLTATVKKK